MKKCFYLFIVVLLPLVICGCPIPGLFSLFTDGDLVFNPALVGTWVEPETHATYTVHQTGRSYQLTYFDSVYRHGMESHSGGDTAHFEVSLGKIAGVWFIDLEPSSDLPVKNQMLQAHLLPAHTYSRLRITEDTIEVSTLDNDWIVKMIDARKIRLSHIRYTEGTQYATPEFLLTANGKELKKFLAKHVNDTKAFPDTLRLVRKNVD